MNPEQQIITRDELSERLDLAFRIDKKLISPECIKCVINNDVRGKAKYKIMADRVNARKKALLDKYDKNPTIETINEILGSFKRVDEDYIVSEADIDAEIA
jgi:hypothetical protein